MRASCTTVCDSSDITFARRTVSEYYWWFHLCAGVPEPGDSHDKLLDTRVSSRSRASRFRDTSYESRTVRHQRVLQDTIGDLGSDQVIPNSETVTFRQEDSGLFQLDKYVIPETSPWVNFTRDRRDSQREARRQSPS